MLIQRITLLCEWSRTGLAWCIPWAVDGIKVRLFFKYVLVVSWDKKEMVQSGIEPETFCV
jgi:hypothetical protein